jgi:hypothetical protein
MLRTQVHLIRQIQLLLRSKWVRPTAALLVLLFVMPVAALAQSSPFDTGFNAIQSLKRRIAEGFALTFSRSDPNGMNVRRRAALVAKVLFVNRPEIVGDGHAVLITRTLQPHGDESPFAIDILQFHTQNPVPASNRTPIADALTSA